MEYARNAATGDTRDMPVAQPDMSQELRPQRLVQRDSNDDLTLSTNRVVKNQIVIPVGLHLGPENPLPWSRTGLLPSRHSTPGGRIANRGRGAGTAKRDESR
ncbi:hypothetical protein LOZ66_001092 [Ophidiomyces ophidiicola]|nr:hypothetical protein LOZ66_001092 [Ophidiomyces ophidiicola]